MTAARYSVRMDTTREARVTAFLRARRDYYRSMADRCARLLELLDLDPNVRAGDAAPTDRKRAEREE